MKYHNQISKVITAIVCVSTFSLATDAKAQLIKNSGQVLPMPGENPTWVIPKPTPRPLPLPPKPPVPPTSSRSIVKINLNHQEQEYMLCVPTSASMMLNKFGWNYPPRQIKLATLGLPWYGPTTPFNHLTPMNVTSLLEGMKYLGVKNWRSQWYPLSDFQKGLNDIKESIRQGVPVMIFVSYGNPIGHAMVVSGYDDVNQRLIINDPGYAKPGIVYYSYTSLRDDNWKSYYFNFRGVMFMGQYTPVATTTIARGSAIKAETSSTMKKLLDSQSFQ